MKQITQFILVGILVFVIGFGEYQIFIKGPEYAKPHSGLVLYSYESHGRHSSTWLATIKFDNGDVKEVNTGSYQYYKGDRFTGSLSWNPILGASGTAYSWRPSDWVLVASIPAILFNIMFIIGSLIAIFMYAFGKKDDGRMRW
jgi:hypothetical protein